MFKGEMLRESMRRKWIESIPDRRGWPEPDLAAGGVQARRAEGHVGEIRRAEIGGSARR